MVCLVVFPSNSVSRITSWKKTLQNQLHHSQRSTDIDVVTALLRDVCDGAQCARGKHDFVIIDQRVFVNASIDITSGNVVSNLAKV